MGGLADLKASTGARVYASEIEAEAIVEGHSSRKSKRRGLALLQFAMTHIFFRVKRATVDEFLTDGQVLPILGGLRVVATPGHTPGHISFFAPDARILFAGDSLASEDGGLRRSKIIYTWNQEQADASIRLQAALGAKIVCAAHGDVVMDAVGKFPEG